MVHGDLSNYNILNQNEEPVIIDVSQSVVLDNPISHELLQRDIKTLVNEYKKLGVKTSYDEVYEYVDFKLLVGLTSSFLGGLHKITNATITITKPQSIKTVGISK